MLSKRNTQILCLLTNLCHFSTFSIFPIQYKPQDKIFRIKSTESRKRTILLVVSSINLVTIFLQLILSILNFKISNIIVPIFNGISFIVIIASAIYILGFQSHATEFCTLLNCVVRNEDVILYQNPTWCYNNENLLLVLVLSVSLSAIMMHVVLIPIGYILLIFTKQSCSISILLDILLVIIKVPTLYAASIISAVSVPILLLSLKTLDDTLKYFLKILKTNKTCNRDCKTWSSGLSYRKIQILVILANECFKNEFWAAVQFLGAVMSIGLAYTFISYHKMFSLLIQTLIILLLCLILGTVCFILHLGSNSLLISTKITNSVKLAIPRSHAKWGRKFNKSCPVVALKIGPFHSMDRKRGPALLRFVIQRTIFLVVNSK